MPKLILASQSPARKKLLEDLGIIVSVSPTDCDESHGQEAPSDIVNLLARRKLDAFKAMHPLYTLPVLTCDTLVFCDGNLIGKAATRKEAFSQLASFCGKTQAVFSGWALWYRDKLYSDTDIAYVTFKQLNCKIIDDYLDTKEWIGAAGSYRIQGRGKELVSEIVGDFTTVIGLPLSQISEILGTNCARL
nr:Maf family protein [uncultured Sphaerochaeta sp.]